MSQAYGLQVWKLGLPTQLAAGYTFSDYGDLVLPLMGVLKLMAWYQRFMSAPLFVKTSQTKQLDSGFISVWGGEGTFLPKTKSSPGPWLDMTFLTSGDGGS